MAEKHGLIVQDLFTPLTIISSDLFNGGDGEPRNISKLIKEYESEEKEVEKDIDWLKGEMDSMHRMRDLDRNPDEWFISKTALLKAIDQLDEPEILSPEWIEENEQSIDYRSTVTGQFVESNKLQNIIVPKQEEMKVPKMWHDVIVQNKEDGHSLRWTLNYIDDLNVNDVDSFARAWIAYPNIEVEEEQKYYIDLETAAYVAKWGGNGQVDIYTDGISGSDEYELHLTEKEIKDYDERFWPFRKPVEEMEE